MAEFKKVCTLNSDHYTQALCGHQQHNNVDINDNTLTCMYLDCCDFQKMTIDINVNITINMECFKKHPIQPDYLVKHVENALAFADSDYIRTSKVN